MHYDKHGNGYTYQEAKLTMMCWTNMLHRCRNPNAHNYHLYGARGIRVCRRWNTFDNFLYDMGIKPAGKSIERKNNSGHYTPDNCVWATPKEQIANRRNTLKLPWKGRMVAAATIADEIGVDPYKFVQRMWQRVYRQNYTPEEAIADLYIDGRGAERRKQRDNTLWACEGKTVQEWCVEHNVKYDTIKQRIHRARRNGATVEQAIRIALGDTGV